jgi:uncharacterized protein YpmB
MNRKKKIIIVASVVFLLLMCLAIIVLVSSNKPKETNNTTASDKYYVEESVKKYAKATKLAVESFATYDKSESATARNSRLNQAFTQDSKVYSYSLSGLSSDIDKTKARLVSVNDFGGEDEVYGVSAVAKVDYYVKNKLLLSQDQTYFVYYRVNPNESVPKPYNIEQEES